MRMALVAGLAMALAGCAHGRAVRGGSTITYATSPCFGACPVYTITLGPDGQGIFNGQRFTALTGERRFQATPEQVRAFTDRLAPYRPSGEELVQPGNLLCKKWATDQLSVDIRWQPALASASHLSVYFGCDMDSKRAMHEALFSAPDLLPVANLIGRH